MIDPSCASHGSATLADHVHAASARLKARGLAPDEAARSASILARWLLGWSAADWLTRRGDRAPADFLSRFLPLVDRRARHEPVAYITGEREFYGRSFLVTPDVLVPRPETESVVEEALALLKSSAEVTRRTPRAAPRPDQPGPLLVDVGTGSGCLAITLALEWPPLRIIATDISQPALEVAQQNTRRLGAIDRVTFKRGPFLDGVTEPIAFIVANPPYVAETDRASLSVEVTGFEPAAALFAGADGLAVIRELLPRAAAALAPGGWLVMEIGHGQLSEVQDLIAATSGLTFDHFQPDLQGVPRVVVINRTSPTDFV